MLPVMISNMARCRPTRRASFCVPPPPGKMPTFTSGKPELCALARNNDVCAQSQLKPAAKRKAFDRGDQRLWTVHDRAPVFLHIARHDFDRAGFRHLADIGARGKRDIRSGHDDAAHGIVGTAARDFIGKPRAHIEIERVAHLRAVDLQDDNVARRTFNDEENPTRPWQSIQRNTRACFQTGRRLCPA